MASITTWNRIEPRARSVDFAESLAARVHDPMWFLARQWQMQEFRGEDAGSAVAVHLRGTSAPITRVRLGPKGPAMPYPELMPLEAYVEREPYRVAAPTTRDAAEAGLVWLRMLEKKGLGAHRQAYIAHLPLAPQNAADLGDPDSERFRRLLGGRVPDGAALYTELDAALRPSGGGPGALPAAPDVGEDTGAITEVAHAWLSWWDTFTHEPEASLRSAGCRHAPPTTQSAVPVAPGLR